MTQQGKNGASYAEHRNTNLESLAAGGAQKTSAKEKGMKMRSVRALIVRPRHCFIFSPTIARGSLYLFSMGTKKAPNNYVLQYFLYSRLSSPLSLKYLFKATTMSCLLFNEVCNSARKRMSCIIAGKDIGGITRSEENCPQASTTRRFGHRGGCSYDQMSWSAAHRDTFWCPARAPSG